MVMERAFQLQLYPPEPERYTNCYRHLLTHREQHRFRLQPGYGLYYRCYG